MGTPEVAQAYTRARELCRQMGETPDVFPVLRGLWVFHEARVELQVAHELAEQLLVLAQRLQDPVYLIEAYRALGNTLFWLGEFAPARVYLEQAIALYDVQQHRSLAFLYGTDPAVICLSYAAWALWLLGYPDQARRRSAEALTLAQELSHSPSLAVALVWATYLHQSCRDVLMVQERAEALMGLAAEQGFQLWLAVGTTRRDWALVQQGRPSAEELAQLHQGLAACWATGAELEQTYWLALLAEAHGTVGQAEEGLGLLREALVVVEKSGEHCGRRSCIGSRATCCCTRPFRMHSTLKHVLPGPRHGPPPAGEVTRAAGGDEPGTAVAASGQTCRSPPDAR